MPAIFKNRFLNSRYVILRNENIGILPRFQKKQRKKGREKKKERKKDKGEETGMERKRNEVNQSIN